MEGTLKNRNGKLYVVHAYDELSEPFRQLLWYRVLETRGTGYGERPETGDVAVYSGVGTGEWRTRNPSTHRSTGSVSTGTGSMRAEFEERVSIPPPAAGGKELRWHDGRWEKLLQRGWVPAGEGKAKRSAKAAHAARGTSTRSRTSTTTAAPKRKKTAAQLDREISGFLGAKIRRPAAHNPVVFRKTAMPPGTICKTLRGGRACGGHIPPGGVCQVCAFEDDFIREFVGFPEDR